MFNACSTVGSNLAPLFLRLAIGAVFVWHGWPKLMDLDKTAGMMEKLDLPYPYLQAIAASLAEVGCGALLILGLFTRLATIPLLVVMGVAIWKVHWGKYPLDQGGMEYPLVLAAGLFSLLTSGAGALSMDRLFFRRPVVIVPGPPPPPVAVVETVDPANPTVVRRV